MRRCRMQPSAISPPPIRKIEDASGVEVGANGSLPKAPKPKAIWLPKAVPLMGRNPLKRIVPEIVQSPPLLAGLKTIGAGTLFVIAGPDPE